MSYGYSQRLVAANKTAKADSRGAYLGSRCIKLGIPVSEVADALGVSRSTVYNWFWGAVAPSQEHTDRINEFLRTLGSRK